MDKEQNLSYKEELDALAKQDRKTMEQLRVALNNGDLEASEFITKQEENSIKFRQEMADILLRHNIVKKW